MARKSWDELTPAYRARLERNGITRESHAGGASIRKAVGHSWDLPSMRARYQRRVSRETAKALAGGNVNARTVAATIDAIGIDRAAVIIDWQAQRTKLGKVKGGKLTLEKYVDELYGPDAWDDQWEADYEALDDSWDYYHD